MSLFSSFGKPSTDTNYTKQKAIEELQDTLHQIQTALNHSQPSDGSQTPSAPSHSSTGMALVTIGLAALAGAAVYAARTPHIPNGITPLDNFNLNRYLGKWYEIARIDHLFERGLQRTQAEYSLHPDGSIQVVNRGFDPKRNEWKIAHGRAQPTLAPDIAALKVSFFGPFYAGYNVVAIGKNYEWAMVIGDKLDNFWILSRNPSLPEGVEDRLISQARLLGVDTQKIIWIHQDGVNPTGSYN